MLLPIIIRIVAATLITSSAFAGWESTLVPKDFTHRETLDLAINEAKKTQKSVILYYTRTNCPPCTVLRGVLSSEPTASLFRKDFVFTAVWGSSMGHTERESYRSKFGIQGAPTWVVFSENGDYICTAYGGFHSAESAKELSESIEYLKTTRSPASQQIRGCTK